MDTETRINGLIDRWEEMRALGHAPDDRGALRRLPGAGPGGGRRLGPSGRWIRPSRPRPGATARQADDPGRRDDGPAPG